MMRALSGHTEPYAVLGHPIGHTLSPLMHNAAFDLWKRDAIYLAFDVLPERLMDVLPAMAHMGFRGVNLTVPHKQVAFENLEHMDDIARLFGAVNTIAFTPEGLVGHNTDGYGFLKALDEAFGCGVEGRHVLVVGAGGAGRAVALMAADAGAATLCLVDLDGTRAEIVAREITRMDRNVEANAVPLSDAAAIARDMDLLVQATPLGLRPEDPAPLDSSAFVPGQLAFDLVYMYPETAFMKMAREAGARAANGLGMLLHQGARALEIWTGQSAPVEVMRQVLEQAVYGK